MRSRLIQSQVILIESAIYLVAVTTWVFFSPRSCVVPVKQKGRDGGNSRCPSNKEKKHEAVSLHVNSPRIFGQKEGM